jgi:hypothetical protein
MERDGGKGDAPRPLGIPMDQFDKQWDEIFKVGNKEPVPFAGYIDIKEIEDGQD